MRWAALAVVALAGCLGAGPDGEGLTPPPSSPEPTAPTPPPLAPPASPRIAMLLDFGYAECDGQRSHFELPAETLEQHLPAGYKAAGPLEYLWMGCASFATARAAVNQTVYGHVAVRIEAPADALDATEHWYRLRMLTGPDVLAAVWRAAAYDVYSADFAASGGPGPRTVALGEYAVTGAELIGGEPVDASVAYYTEVQGGRLEWSGTLGLQSTMAIMQLGVPSDDPYEQAQNGIPDAAWSVRGDVPANDLWLRTT